MKVKSNIFDFQNTICCEDQFNVTRGINELSDQSCGRCGTSKVFGGREVTLMTRPWMVLLSTRELLENTTSFTCGGSLIHKRELSL